MPAAGNLQKSQSLKKTSGLSVIKCSHVLGSKPLETSTVLKCFDNNRLLDNFKTGYRVSIELGKDLKMKEP